MLSKCDKFIRNILFESTENEDEKKKMKELYHTNSFYLKFIEKLADECHVLATKQRENCFQIFGSLKSVKNFFSKFKVDDTLMDNPADFMIYSPMFSYGETKHNLKRDEDYPDKNAIDAAPYTHEIDNSARDTVHGTWFPLMDEKDVSKKIKAVKPSEISKYFNQFFPKANKDFNENICVYVEFQVNCEGWKNQIFDEMSEYAKTPDEMNEQLNEDDDDFDYTQLNVKNENDESTVKAALKEVKRTSKEYNNEFKSSTKKTELDKE